MALAAGWMAGGGLEPPVGPDESRRPTAARSPGAVMPEVGFEPTRDYSQGILSPLIFSIDHNPGHASPRWTTSN